jgi:nucleotide-binding universal stress UspA family protein
MRILLATDGSEAAAAALAVVSAMPLAEGSAVLVVHVMSEPVGVMAPYGEGFFTESQLLFNLRSSEREAATAALEEAVQRLARPGVVVTSSLREGEPSAQLLAAAAEFEAELIVLGARGLSALDRFLLGSVSHNVSRHARCPVLVARGAPRGPFHRVVLAVDGSENSRRAAEVLGRFPLAPDATITAVHVVRPYAPFPGFLPTDRAEFDQAVENVRARQLEHAGALVADAARRAGGAFPVRTELRTGDPAAELLGFAEEHGADLLALGARGVSLIEGLLVGSVADRILKDARCSTLLVH